MCGSTEDIQYPTAENRPGKKEEEEERRRKRRRKKNHRAKYNGLPYSIGRP